MLQCLSRNLERLQKTQNTLSSGKRINKPSDDPMGITKALAYRAILSQYEQYIRNIDGGLSWLNHTSSALEEVNRQLVRSKEIAIAQATSTSDEQTRAAAAVEVDGILDQVLQLANTKLGGGYIFAGSETLTQPFKIGAGVEYSGNFEKLRREIGPQDTIEINIIGSDVFQTTLEMLIELKGALQNNDQEAIGSLLDDIDEKLTPVLNARVEMGAKVNRLEMTKNSLLEAKTNITGLLSETEDADMVEAITDFMTQQNAYQAALAAAARIIQPSLVDFLR